MSRISPAAITPIGVRTLAQRATARAFRKHPARIRCVLDASVVSVGPFGEGSTTRVPGLMPANDRGDSEYGRSDDMLRRFTASTAHRSVGKGFPAEASATGYGYTPAPRAVATSTAVLNDSTSTMISRSTPGASVRKPLRPIKADWKLSLIEDAHEAEELALGGAQNVRNWSGANAAQSGFGESPYAPTSPGPAHLQSRRAGLSTGVRTLGKEHWGHRSCRRMWVVAEGVRW